MSEGLQVTVRRPLYVTLLGLICTGILISGWSHKSQIAQSAPSSPTPLPSETVVATPTGGSMLDRMMRAWQAARSDHFTMQDRSSAVTRTSTTTFVGRDAGDVDWQNPPIFQMSSFGSQTKRTANGVSVWIGQELQIYDQNLLAIRIGIHKWSCTHFFAISAVPGTPFWDETAPFGVPGKNLGSTRINGETAWHVRSVMTEKGPKGSRHPKWRTVRDYFGATATYLPVEIKIRSTAWNQTGTRAAQTTLRLSKFGESVHVALPSACNNK
jgi:hypothetical protein